jgi:hypothetical protein
MDFVHDQLATGRKIRVLTIVDAFSRFSPAVDPRFSYRGEDVVQSLHFSFCFFSCFGFLQRRVRPRTNLNAPLSTFRVGSLSSELRRPKDQVAKCRPHAVSLTFSP